MLVSKLNVTSTVINLNYAAQALYYSKFSASRVCWFSWCTDAGGTNLLSYFEKKNWAKYG